MENPKPKWQWPTERLLQILFVLIILVFLSYINILRLQLFEGHRLQIETPTLYETIEIGIIVIATWVFFATRKGKWGALGLVFISGGLLLRRIAGYITIEHRQFLEILIVLLTMAEAAIFSVAILRGEWNKNPRNEQLN